MSHPSARAGFDPTLGSMLRVNGIPVLPASVIYADITSTDDSAQTVALGTIPKGAIILGAITGVEAQPTGGTETLQIGWTGSLNAIAAPDPDQEAGVTLLDFTKRLTALAQNRAVIATYDPDGTDNTGKIRVMVFYAVPWVDFSAGNPIDAHRSE